MAVTLIGSMNQASVQAVYGAYVETYTQAGLAPWGYDEWHWRAVNWHAVGDIPGGFVTAKDNRGVWKLTGMCGPNARAKVRAMMELSATGAPIWGAMDLDIAERLARLGFSRPPALAMRALMPLIKADDTFYSGGTWGEVGPDGGTAFDLIGTGRTTKYFVGNRAFFRPMLERHAARFNPFMLALADDETREWFASVMS